MENRSKIYIFDLDGSLFDIRHRVGYVRTRPSNWDAFNNSILIKEKEEFYQKFLFRLIDDDSRENIDNVIKSTILQKCQKEKSFSDFIKSTGIWS